MDQALNNGRKEKVSASTRRESQRRLGRSATRETTRPSFRGYSARERRECSGLDRQKSAQLAKSGPRRKNSVLPPRESPSPIWANACCRTESGLTSGRKPKSITECGAQIRKDRDRPRGSAWFQGNSGRAHFSNHDLVRHCAWRRTRTPTPLVDCPTIARYSGRASRRCQLTRSRCHLRTRCHRVAARLCLGHWRSRLSSQPQRRRESARCALHCPTARSHAARRRRRSSWRGARAAMLLVSGSPGEKAEATR